MIVSAHLAPNWNFDKDSFADLTTVPVTRVWWDDNGNCLVDFESDLPPAEAKAVKRRLLASSPEKEALLAAIDSVDPSTFTTMAAMRPWLKQLKQLLLAETD